MPSAEAIKKAHELLASGRLTPEQKASLEAKLTVDQPLAQGTLGDPRNLSGENALEAIDRELPERVPSPEEQQQTANKVGLQGLIREGQPKPEWNTPGAQLVEQTFDAQAAEYAGLSYPEMQRKRAAEKQAQREKIEGDLALPNLSKDPELFRPPAYTSSKEQNISVVAPTPQALVMSAMGKETPVSNLALFGAGPPGTLPGVSVDVPQSIPFLGHDVWYEPSIEQFRRDMGNTLRGAGIDPDKVTEEDPVYRRYADALWAQRYEEAVQKDESVVRQSQEAERDDPLKGAAALKKGIGFIMGLQKGFGAGAPVEMAAGMLGAPQEEVQTLRQVAESEPAANFIGTGLGALAPTSVPQRLMAGASKAIPAVGAARAAQGLAPTGLDVAGNVLRSTAIGGLTNVGEQVASDTIQNLGDVSRGADPTVSPEQMGDNALMAGAFGSAFGAGGEILGQGAQAGKRALLRSSVGHRLQTMENADIEPGLFTRKPKAVKEAQQRTAAAGLGNDVQSQASNELRDPIARAWRDISEGGTKEELPQLRHQVDEYFRSPEGAKNRVPLNNTADAVIDLIGSRADDMGQDLPFINTRQFQEIRDKLFETRKVTQSEAAGLKEGGWRILPTEGEDGMLVVGRPRELNAQEMQTVVDRLDDLAGFSGKELTGPKEQAWRTFNKAVRRDRDKFARNQWTRGPGGGQLEYTTPDGETVTGFSALMAQMSDAKRKATKRLAAAGLDGKAPTVRGTVTEIHLADSQAPQEYVDSLASAAQKKLSALSPDELSAYRQFQKTWDKSAIEETPELRSVLEKMAIQNPTDGGALFRGLALDESALEQAMKTGHFNVTGYSPASFIREFSETFPRKTHPSGRSMLTALTDDELKAQGKRKVLLRIQRADKVYSLLDPRDHGSFEEVILPPGSKLTINGAKNGPDGVVLDVSLKSPAASAGWKSAVREGLPLDVSERQSQQVDKLIQQYGQTTGQARRDEAALKVARAAGVENELKMWAGIFAMQKGGPREGMAVGQSGIRGWLAGGLPDLALRTNKTLNTLGAKPLGQAPKPSEELRALLRRMAPSVTGADPHPGPSPFNLLGLTSGGGAAFSVGLPSEQSGQLLDPQLYGAVMGNKAKEELVRNLESLSEPEQGILVQLAEAVGRGIGEKMPPPAQQPAKTEEEVTP